MTETVAYKPRGLFFEDFVVGKIFLTPSRTVMPSDIASFAALTGDFNYIHANIEYVKEMGFDQPLAHGPLIYGMIGGLLYATGMNEGTLVSLLQVDEWKLVKPVFAGDTICLHSEVIETKPTKNPERGVVKFKRTVLNQRHEPVQTMLTTILYRTRASDKSTKEKSS
jgi:acyl dehydratase